MLFWQQKKKISCGCTKILKGQPQPKQSEGGGKIKYFPRNLLMFPGSTSICGGLVSTLSKLRYTSSLVMHIHTKLKNLALLWCALSASRGKNHKQLTDYARSCRTSIPNTLTLNFCWTSYQKISQNAKCKKPNL